MDCKKVKSIANDLYLKKYKIKYISKDIFDFNHISPDLTIDEELE